MGTVTKEDLAERNYQLGKTDIDPKTGKTKAELRKQHKEAENAQEEAIAKASARHKQAEVEQKPIDTPELQELLKNNNLESLKSQAEEIAKSKNVDLPPFTVKREYAQFILNNS